MEHEIDVVKILSYQPDKVPGDTFDRDVTNPVDGWYASLVHFDGTFLSQAPSFNVAFPLYNAIE